MLFCGDKWHVLLEMPAISQIVLVQSSHFQFASKFV